MPLRVKVLVHTKVLPPAGGRGWGGGVGMSGGVQGRGGVCVWRVWAVVHTKVLPTVWLQGRGGVGGRVLGCEGMFGGWSDAGVRVGSEKVQRNCYACTMHAERAANQHALGPP